MIAATYILPIWGEYVNTLHILADFDVLEGKRNVEVQPEGGQLEFPRIGDSTIKTP